MAVMEGCFGARTSLNIEAFTMSEAPIVIEETYAVSSAAVWRAITEVNEMRQWFFPSIEAFEAVVGFATSFNVECEGQVFDHQVVISDVVDGKRLAYGWRYGGFPGDSTVSWDIGAAEGGTHLTLSHQDWHTLCVGQDSEVFSREACEAGWRYFVSDSLKKYLER